MAATHIIGMLYVLTQFKTRAGTFILKNQWVTAVMLSKHLNKGYPKYRK